MTTKRCNKTGCDGFGKEFVDRGYGYPVCPTSPPRPSPKEMNPLFKGTYREEGGLI